MLFKRCCLLRVQPSKKASCVVQGSMTPTAASGCACGTRPCAVGRFAEPDAAGGQPSVNPVNPPKLVEAGSAYTGPSICRG